MKPTNPGSPVGVLLVLTICLAVLLAIQISSNNLALTALGQVNLVTLTSRRPPDRVAPTMATFQSQSHRCNIGVTDIPKSSFKSQSEEDAYLLNKFFTGLCNGTYIELGGLDGVTYSNSFVFNKELGWKGVLVEGSPDLAERLKRNRPNELLTLNSAVCSKAQTVHYVSTKNGNSAVGGIYEFASPEFRNTWWQGIQIENTIEVPCHPLGKLLKDHVPEHNFFDFWSLDVEGAEFEVLSSVDFTEVAFGVILIEIAQAQPMKTMSIRTFLAQQGYLHLEDVSRSAWFINSDFANLYSHVREG